MLTTGFWQNGLFAVLPPHFFAGFAAVIVWEKSAQKNSPGKVLEESSDYILIYILVILKEHGEALSLKTGENIRTIWAQKTSKPQNRDLNTQNRDLTSKTAT